MQEHGRVNLTEAEGPGKIGEMSQRQDHGELLGPSGKVFKGEEGPAEKKHGSDEQEHRQVKHFNVPYDAREEHANRCKSDPSQ